MLGSLSLTLDSSCVGYAALYPYAISDNAICAEALDINRHARDITKNMERSQVLFGAKASVISELWKLGDECREDDWDGENACALDFAAIQNAEQFIRMLPEHLPVPEIAPEPDGSISLDWVVSRYRLFSISIGVNNRFSYAWLDGSDTGHGVARFDTTTIPVRILDGIRALFST